MDELIYDCIIIGGGPAACAATVYAGRKQLKTLLVTDTFGGQSVVSSDIGNWIGEPHISGIDLSKKLEDQVRAQSGTVEVHDGELATSVMEIPCPEDRPCDFIVKTNIRSYQSKSVIVASGARRRMLNVPGEMELRGKGVAYCSTCDAPLFKGRNVAVVGGGNAGLEAVQDLLAYADTIYLFVFEKDVHGDPVTFVKLQNDSRVKVITDVSVKEVLGKTFVEGIVTLDRSSGKETIWNVGGVFIEIGSQPNSEIAKDVVNIDEHGQIITDMKYAATSHPGVFAAGDVTDDPFKQNNISAGDGVRAALSAYAYLLKRKKISPAAERPQ